MTKTAFNELKNIEFKDEKLSKYASWAIWNKKNVCDLKYIERNVRKLKGNIVFVGLNYGKKTEDLKDWQNFHGVKRLITLLSGTNFEGAYMTDIIKNHYDGNSDKLMSEINKKVINIDEDIKFFFKEIALLNSENIEMYLFGKSVEKIFRKYVIQNKDFQQKVLICRRIHHYSTQVTNFEDIAPVQLDIKPRKKVKVEVKKIEPIWEKKTGKNA
jgi:hypothetical protein